MNYLFCTTFIMFKTFEKHPNGHKDCKNVLKQEGISESCSEFLWFGVCLMFKMSFSIMWGNHIVQIDTALQD